MSGGAELAGTQQALSFELTVLGQELRDRAFVLDRQGRYDAADLAMEVAARIGQLTDSRRLSPT